MKKTKKITLMTKEGKKKLLQELKRRTDVLRVEIANKIEEAKKQGDLSENSAYISALEEYQMNEAKIEELRKELSSIQIVDDSQGNNTVSIGNKVKVKDQEESETVEYLIGGENEADPQQGKISSNSPIGKALIGRKIGDVITISLPKGEKSYEVVSIM